MSNMEFTPLDQTVVLRYLSFEIRVIPRNAPPADTPVPDLPGERCIQTILKVPLNAAQSDTHQQITMNDLNDVRSLLRTMKREGLEVTFGKMAMQSRSLDAAAFDKDFRLIFGGKLCLRRSQQYFCVIMLAKE